MTFGRRKLCVYLLVVPLFFTLYYFSAVRPNLDTPWHPAMNDGAIDDADSSSWWQTVPVRYPVTAMQTLPSGSPLILPQVQTFFASESQGARTTRLQRQVIVKDAFRRCWDSYKSYAWLADELTPMSGQARNWFGGWGATLIDSLDTLWIMGLHSEFELAVAAANNISFETTDLDEINVFETTIRYLGGFLSAYDLSGDKRLLRKAKEVGEMLYVAFDTPNRMPITRWHLHEAASGEYQVAHENVLVAELGSLTLEFTRLSILLGDPKWFDAVQRIMDIFEDQQMTTHLPGMWPVVVNAKSAELNQHTTYTLGAMSDSTYEYLPKMYALVGGLLPQYGSMYERAMTTAIKHNLYRPMLPDEKDVLMSGSTNTENRNGMDIPILDPQGQHLVCFAGGMLALGGKLFESEEHLTTAERLVDGCIWTYQAMPLGIMPETFYMLPCESISGHCAWDEERWKREVLHRAQIGEGADHDGYLSQADAIIASKRLPKGFTAIPDARYILRPEAIESLFILYRTTGREDLPDSAWKMFEAIQENTRTDLANSALYDVTATDASKSDSMESFWMGETLKYFYLMFSEPDLISLDEYVFNTEAHPFKRLLP